ncbi:ULP-PROTEASE domain-containing protein [Fusarium falciforme]|uniref:ULP-PROTEASE domain-containing protein n=1 Tax=Fusarium falciforme TaxID=195108 RepID=UPI0023006FFA|nr:ULP-PROTEASE domain-containing protein [Fusarium falciforme]WAO93911.1 ULP-PROTEASE domain-containing protein [Fusarium falciforme]
MNSRLRALNGQQGPVSTMSCNGPTTRKNSRIAPPPDDRSSKRQKRADERASTGLTSNYFATQKRPIEDVEDDSPGTSTPQIHDLTRDGSQPDTIDVLSVASTSKNTSTAVDISEYRHVQSRNSMKKPRQRRSRAGRRLTPSPTDVDDAHAVQHRNLPPQHRHSSANIDELEVWSQDNPPPSNIVSDIVAQPKRRAGDYAPPVTKRFKIADDFADELSEPNKRNNLPAGKKPTNFSSLVSQSPNRSRQRGDIHRTAFQPLRPVSRGREAVKMPEYPDLTVIGAASGRYRFYAEKPDQQVKLHLGDYFAKVVDEGKGTVEHAPWLEIRKKSVKSIEHAATNSCFIHITRSMTAESPGTLVMQLASKNDALCLHNWLYGCCKQDESDDATLGLKFKTVFQKAKDFEAQGHKQPKIRSPAAARLAAVMEQTSGEYSEIRDPFKGEPVTQRPVKLKDQMKGVPEPAKDAKTEAQELEEAPVVTRSQRPETRRTRRSSPVPLIRDKTPDRWSMQNPGWDKDWHRSLVYPPTGKNRATVDRDDIPRLDEGEFLNDNLISFYLRYLQIQLEKERPEVLDKVYIFNTFFFEKLRSNRAKINYDGVKAWTARIDLLSYDYIVVPVNENAHWYLAIIYNAPRLLPQPEKKTPSSEREAIVVEDNDPTRSPKLSPVERTLATISLDEEVSKPNNDQTTNGVSDTASDVAPVKNAEAPSKTSKRKSSGGTQKFSIDEPRIITLDSLGSAHSPTCKCLRDYLVEEAKHKKGVEITTPPGGMTARNIPEQDNYCDCGVFVLGYMEHFLQDPDEAVRKLLQKEQTNWNIRPSQIRKKVRNLLFTLQQEQHERLEKEKQQKKQLKAAKAGLSSSQAVPSSPQVPPKSPRTPRVNQGVKSPMPNGVKTPVANDTKKTNETSAYFQVMPSEEPTQPETPSRGKPQLMQSLEDNGVTDVKTSSSNEVFHSAPCSPINSASKMPIKSADEVKSPPEQKAAAKKSTPPPFVQTLANSPSQPPGTSSTMRRNSSPVVVTVSSDVPSAKSTSRVHVIDLEPTIMASIEVDKPSEGGPQYDGVDRSIDLTS